MTSSSTDVSIIIPAYVCDDLSFAWFMEAVESSVNQAHVIIYDDCSPYRDKISSYLEDKNVTYARGSINRGVSYARNRAVELCKTKLIFPLDCDDKLDPNAIERMVQHWKGIPIYADVYKFGDNIDDSHFYLQEFDCENIRKYAGVAPVGVLHSKEQWKSIGGWDEGLDLFEDGEYNARLMLQYCAIRLPYPLYLYRIHTQQKTSKYNKDDYRRMFRSVVEMIRSVNMACPGCGGKRGTRSPSAAHGFVSPKPNLPGVEDGLVLAQYVGGQGKGKHYYRGTGTEYNYKVIYGQWYKVDPKDARHKNDPPDNRLFVTDVRINEPEPEIAVVKNPDPDIDEYVAGLDRDSANGDETAISIVADESGEDDFDISTTTVRDIMDYEYEPELAQELLEVERATKNRSKVVEYLESMLDSDD